MDHKVNGYVGVLMCADRILHAPGVGEKDRFSINAFVNTSLVEMAELGVVFQDEGTALVLKAADNEFRIGKEYLKSYVGEKKYEQIVNRNGSYRELNYQVTEDTIPYMMGVKEDLEKKDVKKAIDTLERLYMKCNGVEENDFTEEKIKSLESACKKYEKVIEREKALSESLKKKLEEKEKEITDLKHRHEEEIRLLKDRSQAELDRMQIELLKSRKTGIMFREIEQEKSIWKEENKKEESVPENDHANDSDSEIEIRDCDIPIPSSSGASETIDPNNGKEDTFQVSIENSDLQEECLEKETPKTPTEKPLGDLNSPDEEIEVISEDIPEEDKHSPEEESIYEMQNDEFTFSYNQVKILDQNNNVFDGAEIFVVPLTLLKPEPELMVWVGRDMKSSVYYSSNRPSVYIHCGNFDLIVFGHMENGVFTAEIKLPKKYQQYKLDIDTRNNSGEGHLRLIHNHYQIHIFPVTFKNNNDNEANIIYCVTDTLKNGEVIKSGDNSSERIVITLDKIPYRLLCRWNGKVLQATLSDSVETGQ